MIAIWLPIAIPAIPFSFHRHKTFHIFDSIQTVHFCLTFFALLPIWRKCRQYRIKILRVVWVQKMTKLVQYYIFNATDGHFEQVPVQCNDSLLWKTRFPASIHRSNMDSWKWHIIFSKYWIKPIYRLLKYFATYLIQITVNKTLFCS